MLRRSGIAYLEVSGRVLAAALLLAGCGGTDVAEEPGLDEEAFAIASAMDQIIALSSCENGSLYWRETEESSAVVSTGRFSGVAGVGKGLLAGAVALEQYGLQTSQDLLAPETYFSAAESAGQWLLTKAVPDGEGGSSWTRCVEPGTSSSDEAGGSSGAGCEGEGTPVAIPCPEELLRPATGLQSGVAGVGDFFLDLYEQDAFEGGEVPAATWLAAAEAAGHWLTSSAVIEGEGASWAEVVGDSDPEYYTGLDRGTAGVGYFLLRLSFISQDGAGFLSMATAAGRWLEAQLVPTGTGSDSPQPAYVPVSSSSRLSETGFYHGNAGVAYFFMALYQATGDLCFARDAEAVLAWLSASENQLEELGGITWWPSAADRTRGTFTDVAQGSAGIGWTFLQAARVLAPSTAEANVPVTTPSPEDSFGIVNSSYLQTAERAADWLGNALVGHFYKGVVWWPSRNEPWSEAQADPYEGWLEGEGIPSATSMERYFVMYPGLLRGGAGIGWFLQDLSQHTDSAGGTGCQSELADEAARWLYYNGRPTSGSGAYWTWRTSVVRLVSTRPFDGPLSAGYETGMSGIVAYLARDRTVDRDSASFEPYSVMGFRMLSAPGGEVSACGE